MGFLTNWDPYRQGPWYFKWSFGSALVVLGAWIFLCAHWDSKWVTFIYGFENNIFSAYSSISPII